MLAVKGGGPLEGDIKASFIFEEGALCCAIVGAGGGSKNTMNPHMNVKYLDLSCIAIDFSKTPCNLCEGSAHECHVVHVTAVCITTKQQKRKLYFTA